MFLFCFQTFNKHNLVKRAVFCQIETKCTKNVLVWFAKMSYDEDYLLALKLQSELDALEENDATEASNVSMKYTLNIVYNKNTIRFG